MNGEDQQSLRDEIAETPAEQGPMRRPILLVDDDSEVREALRLSLERKFDVVGASSGTRILELLDSYEPVLVILDVNLPGKNGFKLCETVRASPRHRHLPIMLLTALRDDESLVKSVKANADAFFSKPFEPTELEDTIERLVASSAGGY